MRGISLALGCLAALSSCAVNAAENVTKPLGSKQILKSTFTPPQVFRNANLVRSINLDKSYPRETVNVIIENIDSKAQDEYYLPFEASIISRIGGIEVKDKKDPSKGGFVVELAEFDTDSSSESEYYRIRLPSPLAPKAQQTLSITYHILSALTPLPAAIGQTDKQYVAYNFSAYMPSAYVTLKQKTKIKFPTTDVPDFTTLPELNTDGKEDPQRQGNTFTYGPYGEVPAGASESVVVRYEFTKPLLHATRLERDLEVSHWGGNLATEERYWLTNNGAKLKNHFSRVSWQSTQYYNPPTSALKQLNMPLRVGSMDPYFTDDIGNVSTSRWRSNAREASLELKPRYPLFGGWNYKFRVGWNGDLKNYLRQLKVGDGYVLRVPFLEGPRQGEGIEYEKVFLSIILPEGAKNVKFETKVPIVDSDMTIHRTFMDTSGRTTIKLTAINLSDDMRDRDIIVTYEYPFIAGFRKPITIFLAALSVFGASWVIGQLDVSIGKKKA